jgi:hypothetical protein
MGQTAIEEKGAQAPLRGVVYLSHPGTDRSRHWAPGSAARSHGRPGRERDHLRMLIDQRIDGLRPWLPNSTPAA